MDGDGTLTFSKMRTNLVSACFNTELISILRARRSKAGRRSGDGGRGLNVAIFLARSIGNWEFIINTQSVTVAILSPIMAVRPCRQVPTLTFALHSHLGAGHCSIKFFCLFGNNLILR